METTEIPPERTVGQIQEVLSSYGVRQVRTEYDAGQVSAVSFTYPVNGEDIPFRLPCRWEPLAAYFKERRRAAWYSVKDKENDALKAKRVAWRQILKWVQAQLALVDTKMVKMQEVFMPYIQLKDGKTIYESLEARNFSMQLEHK